MKKKKLLKIVLPLSLVAVLLIGLLLFFLIPPKKSNFLFDLCAHYTIEEMTDTGIDPEKTIFGANVYSYKTAENSTLSCPVGQTVDFDMLLLQKDRRKYKTVYQGEQFINIEISKDGRVIYSPDLSQSHSYTIPNIMGVRLAWSIDDCTDSYTFTEAGTYTVIARSKFKTKGKHFDCSTYPLTIIVE